MAGLLLRGPRPVQRRLPYGTHRHPGHIAERIVAYKRLGVDLLLLGFLHYHEEVEYFGKNVLPLVRELEDAGRSTTRPLRRRKVQHEHRSTHPVEDPPPAPDSPQGWIGHAARGRRPPQPDAAARDKAGATPYTEIQLLKDSGLVTLLGPAEHGGGGRTGRPPTG
ncbi:hypothetical protein SCYAM73S_05848 [Streptomyces cyaneofuscatus]